jgi:hypothetical protein
VIEQPRAAPLSLLVVYTGLLLTQLIMLSHTRLLSVVNGIPMGLSAITSVLSIFIIMNMPLRDPKLSCESISPAYTAPTAKLRTPEDNLTPWQYMSVSWMAPLIVKSTTGKLEDEDVWDLGWEFKHARLHNAFRVLKGSVTHRLLVANGMDLVRTSSLSLLQLVTSEFKLCRV